MNTQEMRSAIEAYVLRERERRGVTNVDTARKPEPSGEAFGEFNVLLERQLMTTKIGFGGWKELDDEDVLISLYQLELRRTGETAK